MANTTFNGPVRSENGFEEWNGSAWVPIGGGSSTTVYTRDGTTQTYTLAAPAAVGETYNIAFTYGDSTLGDIQISLPAIAGADQTYFVPQVTGLDTSGGAAFFVAAAAGNILAAGNGATAITSATFQIVYVGIVSSPGGEFALFQVSGMYTCAGNTYTPVITV